MLFCSKNNFRRGLDSYDLNKESIDVVDKNFLTENI